MPPPSDFEGTMRSRAPTGERSEAVRIWLLGGFQVSVGDRKIQHSEWRLRKAASIVKLLALAPGHRLHREQMMDLLWPDSDRGDASNNLRQVLYAARRVLDPASGSSYLASEDESLVLCPKSDLWVDVEAFEEAAATARRTRDPASYRAALELYSGEPLPDNRYEEWAEGRRQELRNTFLCLLVELAELHEEREDFGPAIEALKSVLTEESTSEDAHTGLMRLYALSGQPGEALSQYERLRDTLSREFGTEPVATVRRLRDEIASGRFVSPLTSSTGSPRKEPSDTGKHNLPASRDRFVGREREIIEIKRELVMTRLLTLTGTGGSGKTRLALELAHDLVGVYPDGVWLVELAGLSEPDLVPQAVATAMRVLERPGQPLTETLVESLRGRTVLLMLDNCEHLVEAAARLVDALLDACPRLRVLATSREMLKVSGETNRPVLPLSVPAPRPELTFAELERSESARLFLERARQRNPSFVLIPENTQALSEVCRELAGMPLAIELAAARVRTLSLDQINRKLKGSLKMLDDGGRTTSERHRTMWGALGWSYRLLEEQEKVLFGRLSVFAGGWTLEAAETVGAGGNVEKEGVTELLSGLVDKSLMVADLGKEGEIRYRMLEPVRQYALEKLHGSRDSETVRRRHAEHFLALLGEAEPRLWGPEEGTWLNRLESEHDNVRAALSWSLGEHDPGLGLRLAAAFWKFWDERGYLGEGSAWLREALAKGGDAAGAGARATALHGLGHMASALGDFEQAEACQEGAFALYEQLGDRAGVAQSLSSQGWIAFRRGDTGRASRLFEDGLAAARESENQVAMRRAINALAVIAFDTQEPERARRLWEDALAVGRKHGDHFGVARVLINMGFVDIALGNYEQSTELLEEALAIGHRLNSRELLANSLLCLGLAEALRGRPDRAKTMLVESLEIDMLREAKADIDEDLEALATTAGALGQLTRAARLWGAAEALREAIGATWALPERMVFEPPRDATRVRLGDTAWQKAFAEGKAMRLEEAVEYALSEEEPTTPARKSAGARLTALTRREATITSLVAQGLTNRQIASELVISEHTAATHVSRILKKLGLHSRSQLSAWVAEQGLHPSDMS